MLNISDFSLYLYKNCTPTPILKNLTHIFPSNPHLKICLCQASHPPFYFILFYFFWKFVSRFKPPVEMERFTLCFPDTQYLIFGLQLCPINHKNCKSWNLKTHIFEGKVWHHILKQINHFQWRHEVCLLNQFSCTKFNHLR